MKNITFSARLVPVAFFLMLFSLAPIYGQEIHAVFSDNVNFHVFKFDGSYEIYDFDNDQTFSGAYALANGAIYFYDNRGRLTSSYYISGNRKAIFLSGNDGSWRLNYVSTPEDFYAAALLGLGLQALFGN
ncbi:MAG: hypothetical protein SFV52_07750 [Saprospiraceae bacterium]|nr:hypothetical protein [Saprospiraceae bacterium]